MVFDVSSREEAVKFMYMAGLEPRWDSIVGIPVFEYDDAAPSAGRDPKVGWYRLLVKLLKLRTKEDVEKVCQELRAFQR